MELEDESGDVDEYAAQEGQADQKGTKQYLRVEGQAPEQQMSTAWAANAEKYLKGHLADIGGKVPADNAGDASPEMRALFARHGPVLQRSEPFKPVSKCSGKTTNLIEAAGEGCVECVKKCIGEAGRVVNSATALIEAAKYGHLEIAQLLVPHEAKMRDAYGFTALVWAVKESHLEIVWLLMDREAKVQLKIVQPLS